MLNERHVLVRRARADAQRFLDDTPEALEYQHIYGDVRVRVLRGGRMFVYDATGHSMLDPIWDSDNPT